MNVYRHIKTSKSAVTILLITLVVAAWLVSEFTGDVFAKPGGKGGKGGGKTNSRVVRIYFEDSPRILTDGVTPSNVDPEYPLDPTWDYWDQKDLVLENDAHQGSQSNLSGGGRLHFFTFSESSQPVSYRYLVLDLTPGPGDPAPPDIDAEVYPGTTDPPPISEDPYIDNVKTSVNVGGMFRKGVTRHPFRINIRHNVTGGGWAPTGYTLVWLTDLHIVEDPGDKNVRTLTTQNPDTGKQDAAIAELRLDGETLGTYYIPLDWVMRAVHPQ